MSTVHIHDQLATTEIDRCPHERPRDKNVIEQAKIRARAVRRVFWITLWLNLLVAVAKGIYSYISGSVTLGADTFHSLLDASSNVIALVGMRLASSPADAGHPYGHRKFETIASLGIGVFIAITLVEVAKEAISALAGGRPPPDIGWVGFGVVIATIIINGLVSRYEHREGERLASPLLVADSHHTKSDMYASTTVLLSFVGTKVGLPWADGVGALLVAVLVGMVAWQVFRHSVPFLVDSAILDPAQIRALGRDVSGVGDIHHIRSRGTRWAIELDLHLEVDPTMSVETAHGVAHRLEDKLRAALPNLADTVVHVEPNHGGRRRD